MVHRPGFPGNTIARDLVDHVAEEMENWRPGDEKLIDKLIDNQPLVSTSEEEGLTKRQKSMNSKDAYIWDRCTSTIHLQQQASPPIASSSAHSSQSLSATTFCTSSHQTDLTSCTPIGDLFAVINSTNEVTNPFAVFQSTKEAANPSAIFQSTNEVTNPFFQSTKEVANPFTVFLVVLCFNNKKHKPLMRFPERHCIS